MIGIITAMDEEAALLLDLLDGKKEQSFGKLKFYIGQLYGKNVVLHISGIGKSLAAGGTATLISRFNPEVLINTGVAGGVSKQLKIGDVVLATELGYHDVDVTAFGYELGHIPRSDKYSYTEKSFTDKLYQFATDSFGKETSQRNVHRGLILTGDQFITNSERYQQIVKEWPECLAVEMESAAIAFICNQLSVPVVITRAISDLAFKDEGHKDFALSMQESADISSSVLHSFLDSI